MFNLVDLFLKKRDIFFWGRSDGGGSDGLGVNCTFDFPSPSPTLVAVLSFFIMCDGFFLKGSLIVFLIYFEVLKFFIRFSLKS